MAGTGFQESPVGEKADSSGIAVWGRGGKRPQFHHSEWLLGGEHYLA